MKQTTIILLTLLLLPFTVDARIPATGMWYPPKHDGHGFDLQKVGNQYILLFYTYDQNGKPTWLQSLPQWDDDLMKGTFNLVTYDANNSPPNIVTATEGFFSINFDTAEHHSSCDDVIGNYKALISWSIEGDSGEWCIVPILAQSNVRQIDYTGHYYSGEADTGWGITLDYQGFEAVKTEVAVLYYYDAGGFPRWAIGTAQSEDGNSDISLNHVNGYCRSCEPQDLSFTEAGSISHQIEFGQGERLGNIEVDVTYPESPGGQWIRQQVPLQPISEAEPGSLSLIRTLPNDKKVAISDVTLVPMTDDFPVLPHHNLIIENGVITEINSKASFPIPENTAEIKGRGLYLSPGMSEMHLHITVGGRNAAEQAGLLMIANGITTALNTGSTFAIDVSELAEKFETGELIGPTFYTAQVAYGPNDSGSAPHTVPSPQEAVAYAQQLNDLSFDFIKFYWQLSVQTIEQLFTESENHAMPVIGHLPKTQSMFRSFFFGQKLAVHIQEPYVTHMQNIRDESLIPEVADIFLEHGAYLSPTLAVFESYVKISNNDVETYTEYINRRGNQYVHRTIKNAWQGYFNQPFIQVSDRADLDDLFDFYGTMTKQLFDAGVPMLTGTDAPGFPGVMSGYGVHEELRLIHETGIPIPDVFAMTTRNSGNFIAETLDEPIGFGTIELGKRADFILTEANPLESLETIKEPLGVMARGRFWSQEYLTEQLDLLDLNSVSQKSTEPEHMFCLHH